MPEGRYLSRGEDGDRVIIVSTPAAPRAGRRKRRRARPVEDTEQEDVPVTRVTVTVAEQPASEEEAAAWVAGVSGDPPARAAEVRSATLLVNRALGALRAGARDPLVQDVGATRALAIRIGWASGEDLAEGRWSEARVLPPPRRGRLDEVMPQSRVAAVLAGRDAVSPAETLLLRARLDLDAGRPREAALQLPAVARTILREETQRKAEKRAELEELVPSLDEAAGAATAGDLSEEQLEALQHAVKLARSITAAS